MSVAEIFVIENIDSIHENTKCLNPMCKSIGFNLFNKTNHNNLSYCFRCKKCEFQAFAKYNENYISKNKQQIALYFPYMILIDDIKDKLMLLETKELKRYERSEYDMILVFAYTKAGYKKCLNYIKIQNNLHYFI